MYILKKTLLIAALSASVMSTKIATAQDKVIVGHLVDYTGPTSFVGKPYGEGVNDAVRYINDNGGITGTKIDLLTTDYAYKVPAAISNYKRWKSRGMVALQGWGTGDTEALISFVARDKIPVWSASYSGHLTDPTGINPNTKKPAPYNFFYGPSYTDACRALVQWALQDARFQGISKPKFVHTGANHPYPNAPKKACGKYATELGLEVLRPIVVPLAPGDFKAQCLTIKSSGADYVYLGNLGGSVVSLLKSCRTVGVKTKYLANTWAGDYKTVEASKAENYYFASAAADWNSPAPGMKLVKAIYHNAKGGDPTEQPLNHYIRGICTAYFMKEAMMWAKQNGGITGENLKKAMYAKSNWVPAGMEGVCVPATWKPDDHRGVMSVDITSAGVDQNGKSVLEQIDKIFLPRKKEWLGQ